LTKSNRNLELAEFSIVVLARNHNPTILNPDFLKYNGIVPDDWELGDEPLCSGMASRVVYSNGVVIVTQPDKIIFTHTFGLEHPDSVGLSEIVSEYVKNVPHVGYTALGVNPKGFVELGEECDGFVDGLVSDGPWKSYSDERPKYSVKFTYPLDGWVANLTVDVGKIQRSESETIRVVRFDANFHHQIQEKKPKERLSELQLFIGNWESVLEQYIDIVEDGFLVKEDKE